MSDIPGGLQSEELESFEGSDVAKQRDEEMGIPFRRIFRDVVNTCLMVSISGLWFYGLKRDPILTLLWTGGVGLGILVLRHKKNLALTSRRNLNRALIEGGNPDSAEGE